VQVGCARASSAQAIAPGSHSLSIADESLGHSGECLVFCNYCCKEVVAMTAIVRKNKHSEGSNRVEKDRILKIPVYRNNNLWYLTMRGPLYLERYSRNRISEAGAGSA